MTGILAAGLLVALVACGALACAVRALHERILVLEGGRPDGPTDLGITVPARALAALPDGDGTVLFVSATCLACRAVLAARSDLDPDPSVVVVGDDGFGPEHRAHIDVVVPSMEALGVRLTPLVAAVRSGRVVRADPGVEAVPWPTDTIEREATDAHR